MSVIADFSIPSEEFVLSQTLNELPDIQIEVERVVAHTEESMTPYFCVSSDDFDAFERALDDDPSVGDALMLEEVKDERFYRANWVMNVESIAYVLDGGKSTIMEATGKGGARELRLLFPDRQKLSDFDGHCKSRELSFELLRTFNPDNPRTFGEYEVTDDQRDALVIAYNDGYFAVPRETTTEEIAEQLDISAQAVSVCLRRGQANLLKNTLITDG